MIRPLGEKYCNGCKHLKGDNVPKPRTVHCEKFCVYSAVYGALEKIERCPICKGTDFDMLQLEYLHLSAEVEKYKQQNPCQSCEHIEAAVRDSLEVRRLKKIRTIEIQASYNQGKKEYDLAIKQTAKWQSWTRQVYGCILPTAG